MKAPSIAEEEEVKCHACDSEAVYKYGKAWTGKQRFQCLMCGKQFTLAQKNSRYRVNRSALNAESMHLYRIEGEVIRFRCSGYPECKTFKKFRIKEEV